MLDAGADGLQNCSDGNVLRMAAESNNEGLVSFLMHKFDSLKYEAAENSGKFPADKAYKNKHVFQMMLESMNIVICGTPFDTAASAGYEDVASRLLQRGL